MKIKQKSSNPLISKSKLLNEIIIILKIIHSTILPKTAPWTINQQIVKRELIKLSKTNPPITFREKFLNIQNNYTDGSKQGIKVGYAAIFQNQKLLKHLPNESSISPAKVTAIDQDLNIIANRKSSKFIVHSDSKSVLQALQNKNTATPLITRLPSKMNILSKNIIFTWIPSHIGTRIIKFPDFFVWALLYIVYPWNSSPRRSNLLQLQCTCCTIPTTSGRPHRSPLVWACQWLSSQPLSSPQLSHDDSLKVFLWA